MQRHEARAWRSPAPQSDSSGRIVVTQAPGRICPSREINIKIPNDGMAASNIGFGAHGVDD